MFSNAFHAVAVTSVWLLLLQRGCGYFCVVSDTLREVEVISVQLSVLPYGCSGCGYFGAVAVTSVWFQIVVCSCGYFHAVAVTSLRLWLFP